MWHIFYCDSYMFALFFSHCLCHVLMTWWLPRGLMDIYFILQRNASSNEPWPDWTEVLRENILHWIVCLKSFKAAECFCWKSLTKRWNMKMRKATTFNDWFRWISFHKLFKETFIRNEITFNLETTWPFSRFSVMQFS